MTDTFTGNRIDSIKKESSNRTVAWIDFPPDRRFEVATGDILLEKTRAIVNAANGMLAHGGGVAAAIARAAGPELIAESERIIRTAGRIPAGEAVITTAGKLPFMAVIHAVGPMNGEGNEEQKLYNALFNSFKRGEEAGVNSISFPGVSSGIFSVPHEICARAYLRAVKDYFTKNPDSCVKLLRLVLFEGPLLTEVLTRLKTYF